MIVISVNIKDLRMQGYKDDLEAISEVQGILGQ